MSGLHLRFVHDISLLNLTQDLLYLLPPNKPPVAGAGALPNNPPAAGAILQLERLDEE